MTYYGYDNYDQYFYNYPFPYSPVTDMVTMENQSQVDNNFVYPQNVMTALNFIQQALAGETEDRMFYSWLIDNAPSDEDKQIISEIRDNEIGHYDLFKQIYNEITGQMPQPINQEQFTQPENYCAGLAKALIGEQNAVKKYRNILYAMQNRVHINMMTEIITDEIRHGILYNYLYSKNNC